MLFSPSCEYAIRALIFLATHEQGRPINVGLIAKEAGIPHPFLSKILLNLKNHRLVTATKGPGGGYMLRKDANKIRLIDIVVACDGAKHLETACVLGLDNCSDRTPCPLHTEWKRFRREFDSQIHQLTLETLREKYLEKKIVLKS